ncbi:uncharacterized protein N7482_000278 [Penicillium canariense]|uniref:Uncharacterized protein n=1 Tax=Penicillium canariense TaxID=189055 RepID=A0A9W9IHJ7_9EURO|nr:uncharacterized protein N7482_000278 [Penicillium canariense]KAJ5174401.1 hypothetical protein N7482_000278 [Penicillium canariense]
MLHSLLIPSLGRNKDVPGRSSSRPLDAGPAVVTVARNLSLWLDPSSHFVPAVLDSSAFLIVVLHRLLVQPSHAPSMILLTFVSAVTG